MPTRVLRPASPERHRAPSTRRRLAALVVGVAVLAGLVVLALSRIDLAQVGGALRRVNAGWVAVGAVLMVGTFAARSESWYAAIRAAFPDIPIARQTVFGVLVIGMFGSSVAPGRLGEAARAWLIARHTGGPRSALSTVIGTLVSQTLLNVLALGALAVIALAGGSIPGAHVSSILLLVAVPVLLALLLLSAPGLVRKAAAGRGGAIGRLTMWLVRQLGDVGRGLNVFRRRRSAAHSAGLQLLGWALQTGACYAVILSLGLEHRAGIATAAAVLVAVNVTAVLPITPSNLGVFQAACIAVLAPVGVGAATGLAYGLVLQAIEVGCATLLGLPALLQEGLSPLGLLRGEATHSVPPPSP
jgi:phosphatidylinositol alpha-mannosyltransferase